MSNQPPSPRALADRVFSRFVAMYGSQKVGAMWADADASEVRDTWAAAISRYSPQSIGVAMRDLLDSGREWPPTLPEFCELCRRGAVARQQSRGVEALPAPGGTYATREDAAEALARIGAGGAIKPHAERRAWARKLLDRAESGDGSVTLAMRNMAERALDASPATE